MSSFIDSLFQQCRIKQQIRNLEALNLKTVNDSFLYCRLKQLLLSGYVSRILEVNATTVFRARKNDGNTLFSRVKDLWYPPSELIKILGRINTIGESVFYCADSESTAVLEMRPKLGDSITVLQCALLDNTIHPQVEEVAIHEVTGSHNPRYGGTPQRQDEKLMAVLHKEGIEEANFLIRAYLVKEFSKIVNAGNEHEYKTTIAIARLLHESETFHEDDLLPRNIQINGIAYPSIATEGKGANIAFTAEAVDRLYNPVACWVNRIAEVRGHLKYGTIETRRAKSIESDGTIIW